MNTQNKKIALLMFLFAGLQVTGMNAGARVNNWDEPQQQPVRVIRTTEKKGKGFFRWVLNTAFVVALARVSGCLVSDKQVKGAMTWCKNQTVDFYGKAKKYLNSSKKSLESEKKGSSEESEEEGSR